MLFLVLGYDGKDDKAMDRRLAVREEHLNLCKENYEKGIIKFGSAIVDDTGKMVGSMIVCEFESKEELQKSWIDKEPYVIGNVWNEIKITETKIPPFIKY